MKSSYTRIYWLLIFLIILVLSSLFLYSRHSSNEKFESTTQQINLDMNSQAILLTNGLTTEPTNNLSPFVKSKDPFKEFIDNNDKNRSKNNSEDKSKYPPPGLDPFKAKLEEQKNEPHSAISPFGK